MSKGWLRIGWVMVAGFVFSTTGSSAQGLGDIAPPPVGTRPTCPKPTEGYSPIEVVRYLADDALQGRFAGSPGEVCAGNYIAARFAALGLEPAVDGGFFQVLDLASATQTHTPGGSGRNVLGLLPGSDPDLARSVVVIGAHYDHLGFGEFGSTGETGEIHNGADDNASGVSVMLEAARILATGPRPSRSVLFIAFTGEELGLVGSSHYARNPAFPLTRTLAMVNLDMVGRLGQEPMIVYGMGTAPEWRTVVPEANKEVDLPLAFEEAGYGPSDHTSFYAAEIPVLHFFTNVHRDYHRETDDAEFIDAGGLDRIAVFTANIGRSLANRESRLTLIPGVGEPGERSGGYGAWLGTIPDFTPVETGVPLAGVTAGSPAAAADLRKGDILIRIGNHDVEDLQGMTDALSKHAPGQDVTITFLREDRRMTTRATLGDRADRP